MNNASKKPKMRLGEKSATTYLCGFNSLEENIET